MFGGRTGRVVTHIKPEGKSRVIATTPEMAHAANVAGGSPVVISYKTKRSERLEAAVRGQAQAGG